MSMLHSVLAIGLILVMVAVSVQASRREPGPRVPMVALGILGGLAAGIVLGMVLLAYYGDEWDPLGTGSPLLDSPGPVAKTKAAPGRVMGPAPKGASAAQAPNPKTQLAALIAKLDKVVNRPIAVTLDAEGKARLRALLEDLEKPVELSRDEAKARLDSILELLKDQRAALETTGYRWPGAGGGGGGGGMMGGGMGAIMGPLDPPNPFQETGGSGDLKSLRERLGDAP